MSFASAASAWKIATKYRLGKLPSARLLALDFGGAILASGLEPLAISVRHGQVAGAFEDPHRDPFDRMLVAQAQEDDLVLISNETIFDRFGIRRAW